jgi:hypothetical protein
MTVALKEPSKLKCDKYLFSDSTALGAEFGFLLAALKHFGVEAQ